MCVCVCVYCSKILRWYDLVVGVFTSHAKGRGFAVTP